MFAGLAVAFVLAAGTTPAPPVSLQQVAPGVHLLRGEFVAGHQPDGNSIVFAAPQGLIVMDTGRHQRHTQMLIDFARGEQQPVAAIVNSHWHLDHVGGNLMLRDAYPKVRVYASGAIRDALRGFLATYRAQLAKAIAQTAATPEVQAGYRAEMALIDAGARLAPTDEITASGDRTIAGRPLHLGLATRAVTAGDVWVLDPATRVLAAGDLVTVPVPFLDTACPRGWSAALDDLAKQDFTILVPGHGAPMIHGEFESYRRAFAALVACASSPRTEKQCADDWFHDAGPQVAKEDGEAARGMLHYYMTALLRGHAEKTAALCGEPAKSPG